MTGLLWLGFVAGVTTLLVWYFRARALRIAEGDKGMLWVLIGAAVGAVAAEVANILDGRPRRTPDKPKDRAQRRGGTGHFLVLVGPDRCRCGASWPCIDSVAADRLTRQV